MVRTILALIFLTAPFLLHKDVQAHCQVPCGIYDDHARIHAMLEDVATIAKAMKQIQALSVKKDAQSRNQVTRWVVTKEDHASRIIGTIATYFLTQKIKPVSPTKKKAYARYIQMLADHHKVMSLAMKTKQQVNPAVATELRSAVSHLSTYWSAKKK